MASKNGDDAKDAGEEGGTHFRYGGIDIAICNASPTATPNEDGAWRERPIDRQSTLPEKSPRKYIPEQDVTVTKSAQPEESKTPREDTKSARPDTTKDDGPHPPIVEIKSARPTKTNSMPDRVGTKSARPAYNDDQAAPTSLEGLPADTKFVMIVSAIAALSFISTFAIALYLILGGK